MRKKPGIVLFALLGMIFFGYLWYAGSVACSVTFYTGSVCAIGFSIYFLILVLFVTLSAPKEEEEKISSGRPVL